MLSQLTNLFYLNVAKTNWLQLFTLKKMSIQLIIFFSE